MSGTIKIAQTMSKKRGPGRPKKPEPQVNMHVKIPEWVDKMVRDSAAFNGRKLNEEVARRLKTSFGLEPHATNPEDPGGPK
jgi:hypothetical protein